jgi:hypothetical protein
MSKGPRRLKRHACTMRQPDKACLAMFGRRRVRCKEAAPMASGRCTALRGRPTACLDACNVLPCIGGHRSHNPAHPPSVSRCSHRQEGRLQTSAAPLIRRCRASHLEEAQRLSSPLQGSSPAKTQASLRPSRTPGHHLWPSTNCEKLSDSCWLMEAMRPRRSHDMTAPSSSPPQSS